MSRVSNQPPKPAVQNKPAQNTQQNQQATRKAGENAFANRLKSKPETKPKQQQQKLKQPTANTKSASLLAKHGQPTLSRSRGGKTTVADLQAKLEAFQGGEGGKGAATMQGGLGKGEKMAGMEGGEMKLGDALDQQQGQMGDMSHIAGQQMMGKDGLGMAQSTHQIQGGKIPTAMLDKMVEHARVGVNAAGAPEFQFDLKGDVLGGLKMRMSMENGQLKAIFVAENPEVRKLMDGNLQDLKRALEDRGIHIRDLEVRDPQEDQRQRQRDQHNKDREQAFSQE